MSTRITRALLPITLVLVLVATVRAQEATSAGDKLRVRKLTGLSTKSRVFTPSFSTDVGRGVNRAREWQAVTVTYDTAPEWLDELQIQFFVLSVMRDPETKRNVYSLYRNTVRYIDIEQGRNHMAVVFLRPTALLRHGEPVAVAAVFSLDGKVVEEVSDEETKLPEKWWKNPLVTDSEATTIRDGYLLDRSKSPWALINPDDYEVIK
jgi:hypothetical protein